jgi:hypothetical protein
VCWRAQLELEVRVGGELKQILTGKVTLPEIANDDLDEAKLPGGSKMLCDQDGWKPYFEGASKTVWACVKGALTALVEQVSLRSSARRREHSPLAALDALRLTALPLAPAGQAKVRVTARTQPSRRLTWGALHPA